MPTANFEVKTVYPAEGTRKSTKVVGTDGHNYYIKPGDASNVREGSVLEVFYEENEFKGKLLRMAQRVVLQSSSTSPAAAKVLAQATQARAPIPSGPDLRSEEIFLDGVVNSTIRALQVNFYEMSISEGADFIYRVREMYRNGSKAQQPMNGAAKAEPAQAGQQHDPEMADEIPFNRGG